MRKLLPYLRLALFCVALFGVSGAVVLLKQGRLLAAKHDPAHGEAGGEGHEASAEPGGKDGETKAGMAGLDLEGRTGEGAPGARSAAPTKEEQAQRNQAVAAGRALFQVPEPLSIAEVTDLLNDLREQKKELDARKTVLDQRQRELDTMEKELEARRSELIALAERVNAAMPSADGAPGAAETIDPETITRLGTILSGMQPDAAARALATYTPERAAKLLLAMKEQKAALVLGQLKDDVLTKITDALLRAKSAAEGR